MRNSVLGGGGECRSLFVRNSGVKGEGEKI